LPTDRLTTAVAPQTLLDAFVNGAQAGLPLDSIVVAVDQFDESGVDVSAWLKALQRLIHR